MARKTPTVEVIVRDEVTRALERARNRMRQVGGGRELAGLHGGFKGIENGIRSLAHAVAGATIGGFLGAGVIAGIARTTQALGGIARAAQQNRYLAEQLGLTRTQLANLTVRGRALGMDSEQTKAGITSLSNSLRELKVLGENASAYKALVEAGGISGQRLGNQLIAAVRGPGGYDEGIRTFSRLMGGMNTDAQRKLSEVFGLGSIAFRDLYSLGLGDLPKLLELPESDAHRLSEAMAAFNISTGNIKTTLGSTLMPTFELLARTVDKYLQGPGAAIVKQFADWVAAINIPWGSIGQGLEGASKTLGDIFGWVKKTIEDLDPIVQRIGGWTPILLALGGLLYVSRMGGLTWSLMAIGKALEILGKHEFILAALATAAVTLRASVASGSTVPSQQGLRGGPSGPAAPRPGRSQTAPAKQARYNTGGGSYSLQGGAGEDELNDTVTLRQQVRGASAQVRRLANFVTGSTDELGEPSGPSGGQIRTDRAPAAPRGPTTPGPRPTAPSVPSGPSVPAPSVPGAPSGPGGPSGPSGPGGRSGPTPGPTPPPSRTDTPKQGVMIFVHGITGRYAGMGGSIEQVEADARRLAAARGHSGVEFIYGSPAEQERQLRERMKRGGVTGIVGFSGGGGPARRVGNQYPDVKTTVVGAPKVPGDVTDRRRRHMGQIDALASQAEKGRAGPQAPQPQPQGPQSQPSTTAVAPGLVSPVTGSFGENASNPYGAGRKGGRPHSGVDWRAEDGTPAVAMIKGVVTYVGRNPGGYDNYAVVKGADGVYRRYAYHGRTAVRPGQQVDQGQTLGYIARRHLHYEEIHPTLPNGRPNPVWAEFERRGNANTSFQRGTSDPSKTLNLPYRTKVTAGQPLGGGVPSVADAKPSPIIWSNEDEIDRLKDAEKFPLGGFTPIPGRGGVKLKVNVTGPRGVKVAAEGGGIVGSATVDRSDPSGGIEGFSPG